MTRSRGYVVLVGLLTSGMVAYGCGSSSSTTVAASSSSSSGTTSSSANTGSSSSGLGGSVLTGTSSSSGIGGNASTSTTATSTSSSGTGGSTGDAGTGGSTNDAGTGGSTSDAGDAGGPLTIPFDPTGNGSPDAIYWDDAKQVLYVVDDNNNQVWTYTDSQGLQKYATVPDSPVLDDAGHTKLNGITELADGTLVITRFGYGVGGAIYTLSPDGGTTTVPNVPLTRKRITVTVDPATGTIYGDSFTGSGTMVSGEIETVDLANGTTPFATGFGKTVGLLVQNGSILVSDQTNGVILQVPLSAGQLADGGATTADGGTFPVYATLEGPDQLTTGPNGTIFTGQVLASTDGGATPQVRQIAPDGGVTIPFPTTTFTSLADVAYDPTGHRLFVVDSNGTTVREIRIFPVQ